MANDNLGGLEELVLLAIRHLDDHAYGVTIHRALKDAGRNLSVGSLYITLERLENKGYVKSWLGEATPARGGRQKKFFKLTGAGVAVLASAERSRTLLGRLNPGLGRGIWMA